MRPIPVLMALLLLLAGCTPHRAAPEGAASAYGQAMPRDLCDRFDFDPVVAAFDVGTLFAGPIYDHGGTSDSWYSCDINTQKKDGPDQYHYAAMGVKIQLFDTVDRAHQEYANELAKLTAPGVDTSADAVEQAKKFVQPAACQVLILDRNLIVSVIAVDAQGQPLAAAVEGQVEAMARAALAEVRRSARVP
jgi:hypothetical protein